MLSAPKSIALFVALLYMTIYLPLAVVVYSPWWYELSCGWNPRCDKLGQPEARQNIAELTAYFRHQGALETRWSDKERQHLAEVRHLYDWLFIAALAALALLIWADGNRLRRYALCNAIVVLALLALIPVFATFWRDVFHPLLFDNELWRNDSNDVMWYLTPRSFYKDTLALLIVVCAALNLVLWAVTPRLEQP